MARSSICLVETEKMVLVTCVHASNKQQCYCLGREVFGEKIIFLGQKRAILKSKRMEMNRIIILFLI